MGMLGWAGLLMITMKTKKSMILLGFGGFRFIKDKSLSSRAEVPSARPIFD